MGKGASEAWLLGTHYRWSEEEAQDRWGPCQSYLKAFRSLAWVTYRSGLHAMN